MSALKVTCGQAWVRFHLRATLSEEELNRVEFVFTHAPGESAAA